MMPHAVNCRMTSLILLEDLEINAIYVNQEKFKRTTLCNGITYFQPLKLD